MKSVALALAGCLIAWHVCGAAGAIDARGQMTPTRMAPGTARITGIVSAEDTGHPLADATVYLFNLSNVESGGFGRSMVTAGDGRFDFQQLPADRYWLTVRRAGSPPMVYGQRRPGRAGRPIDLAGGQTISDLDVRLVAAGVLAGTVLGADGEPRIHAFADVLRFEYVHGVRQLQRVAGAIADERGMYRVAGLEPGEYFIAASVQRTAQAGEPSTFANPTPAGDGIFAGDMTFYPGTSLFASAEPVKIAAGEERSGLDVRLSPDPVTTVSGIVTGIDIMKTRSAILLLNIEGNPSLAAMSVNSEPDGAFTFRAVPPGSYTLVAHTQDLEGAIEPMQVTVAGKPVNLQVQLRPTHSMSGRVVWRGANPPARMSARVVLRDTRTGMDGMSPVRDVLPDGTFSLDGLCRSSYYITAQQIPPGWSIKAVTIVGRDLTDGPFDYDGSGDVDDVVIEFTNQTTELSGTLTDADAHPAADYTVVAFAEDARFLGAFSRRIQASQSSADGRFVIRGLPPGDYLLAAVDDVEPGAWVEPVLLDRLRASAEHVHLGEVEHKTQDLTIKR
jgi:uncharacterized protein (DUF2141 family)